MWVVRWSNLYSHPDGDPRELSRIEVRCRPGTGAGTPPETHRLLLEGLGVLSAVGGIYKPTVRQSPEQLAKVRLQHLERRIWRKHPLFAGLFSLARLRKSRRTP